MIELTKLQYKILKLINSNENFNLEKLSKKININWYECMQNIEILRNNDLIRIDRDNYFHSLPFGKAYFELKNKQYLKIFITSFVFPFLVSLITTLLTLLLKN